MYFIGILPTEWHYLAVNSKDGWPFTKFEDDACRFYNLKELRKFIKIHYKEVTKIKVIK